MGRSPYLVWLRYRFQVDVQVAQGGPVGGGGVGSAKSHGGGVERAGQVDDRLHIGRCGVNVFCQNGYRCPAAIVSTGAVADNVFAGCGNLAQASATGKDAGVNGDDVGDDRVFTGESAYRG